MKLLYLLMLLVMVLVGCASTEIPLCKEKPELLSQRLERVSEDYRTDPRNLFHCDNSKGIDYSICVLHDDGFWQAMAEESRKWFLENWISK